ncbi:hypothetical protein D3C72_1221070 [compost metagenome]
MPASSVRSAPARWVSFCFTGSSWYTGGIHSGSAVDGSAPVGASAPATGSKRCTGMRTSTRAPSATATPSWPRTVYCAKPLWNRSVSRRSSGCTATARGSAVPATIGVPAGITVSAAATVPALYDVVLGGIGRPEGNTSLGST